MDAERDNGTAELSDTFRRQLEQSLETCDLLEALADDLPRQHLAVWRTAKRQCGEVLRKHAVIGAECIVPSLLRHSQANIDLKNLLLHFQSDYKAMVSHIDDLEDLLASAVCQGEINIGPEALGFALRSHFDILRKHISWEWDVLLPMTVRLQANGQQTNV